MQKHSIYWFVRSYPCLNLFYGPVIPYKTPYRKQKHSPWDWTPQANPPPLIPLIATTLPPTLLNHLFLMNPPMKILDTDFTRKYYNSTAVNHPPPEDSCISLSTNISWLPLLTIDSASSLKGMLPHPLRNHNIYSRSTTRGPGVHIFDYDIRRVR